MKNNFQTLISAILSKVSALHPKKSDVYTKADVYTKKETLEVINKTISGAIGGKY